MANTLPDMQNLIQDLLPFMTKVNIATAIGKLGKLVLDDKVKSTSALPVLNKINIASANDKLAKLVRHMSRHHTWPCICRML